MLEISPVEMSCSLPHNGTRWHFACGAEEDAVIIYITPCPEHRPLVSEQVHVRRS